jgi:putative ABC transport system permease protein
MSDDRWTRLRNIFRPDARTEVDDEVRFHIEMRTRELIEQGLPAADARAAAEARFGAVSAVEREMLDSTRRRRQRTDRSESFLDFRQDVRYAARSLGNSPAFSAAAIATLALGVGATLAVFTVVNGVLLRPLPYKDPEGIEMIWIAGQNEQNETMDLPLTSGFFNDLRQAATTFESIAAFRSWPYALSDASGGDAEPVSGARVSPALFDVLGIRPQIGQPFTREHAVPGASNVAMISHDLWQRRFGGGPVVGSQVMLSGQAHTITGIMPRGFAFPRGAELPAALQFGLRTDVWTPLVFDSTDLRNYGTMNLSAVGRRRAGASTEVVQSEASGIIKRFLAENAPNFKLDYRLRSLSDQAAGKVRKGLLIMLGAVTFVLLIACANVASLLVARVASRQRELAVRAALGAGRSRIARQLVTENLVLAVVGTALGVAVSYWATRGMFALVPGSMPRADDIGLDWRVLSVAAVVAITAGVTFGIAAAYSVSWSRLTGTIASGTRSTGGLSQRLGRRTLVAAEVALSLMLLIGAALLTRSFVELQNVRPGFDPAGVLTANVGLPLAGPFRPVIDGPRWASVLNQITARVAAAPGVTAAGATSALPLSGAYESGGLIVPGRTDPPGQGPNAQYNVVAGRYFTAAGIRLVAGRAFDQTEDAPNAAASIVVNREFVRRYMTGSDTDVIGKSVQAQFEFTRNRPPRTIVGVVENVKLVALDQEATPQVYVPQSQMPYPGLRLVVRTDGDPLRAVDLIKREVRAVDPTATVKDIELMEDIVARSLARQRFSMTLIGVFAGLALLLAIVGLYGVLALIVGQRRREIGVRLALGARPADVIRMVVGEGARVTVVGVVVGVAGAFAMTRVLRSLLYEVSTTDMATFSGAALLVVVIALAATLAPARRAARVDPTTALRSE